MLQQVESWFADITGFSLILNANRIDWVELNAKTEAAIRGYLQNKVLLKIWQNSQESTCARVPFLIKL